MENLKIIWHDQLAEDSFLKFQFLLIKNCENLTNIFESNMLTRFQSLERLDVYDCGSLQEVFEIQRHDAIDTHVVTVIPLKKLYLRHLPKMKQTMQEAVGEAGSGVEGDDIAEDDFSGREAIANTSVFYFFI